MPSPFPGLDPYVESAGLERDLFLERFLGGADNQTLAERYEKTANHIAVRVHNAVRHMRGCLERAGFTP